MAKLLALSSFTREEVAALLRLVTTRDFHPMDGGDDGDAAVSKLREFVAA
jgi:hypothetical protein